MSGLLELFRSRSFWVMVSGVVATVVCAAIPGLQPYLDTIASVIVVLAGAAIGGYGVESTAAAYSSGETKLERQSAKMEAKK